MISFIVPAYNEAQQIAEVIRSIDDAAAANGLVRTESRAVLNGYEVLVVDDASEDDTAALARQAGATVVSVNKRHIAAVRNAGVRASRGRTLVFVDGDTWLNANTLAGAFDVLERGGIGGGACVLFDTAPMRARIMLAIMVRLLRTVRCCGGCFLFTTRCAFERIGGFDETLYASEEGTFAQTLGRLGRFVVLTTPVVTSGRKVRQHSLRSLLLVLLRMGLRGSKGVRSRDGLDLWYDGVRDES